MCFICETNVPKSSAVKEVIFWSPYKLNGKTIHLCEEECHDLFTMGEGCGEFGFQECTRCERWICKRNPKNGYQSWFHSSRVCSDCYQKDMLIHGQPMTNFQPNAYGTYSIQGDFFSQEELISAGFKRDDEMTSIKITSQNAPVYCQRALYLISSGAKIITVYGSLSIFGDEGYISMYVKQ